MHNTPAIPPSPVPSVPSQVPSSDRLKTGALRKAIWRYYKELEEYKSKATHELALRAAFHNLLADGARQIGWTLVDEQTIEGGIRPDGVMRDANNLRRGYWEAKGPESDLDKEIAEKIKKNYPLTNTIFENTRRAVLYQGKRKVFDLDMTRINDVQDALHQFLTYTEPHIERFQTAVLEFKARIPELARDLLDIIEREHHENKRFITAFTSLAAICRQSLDPNLDDKAIDEMLVQHLLTERIFRTVFNNSDFVNRNVIAAEIEKVIAALTSRSFNRQEFLKHLDRYYVAIEGTARGIESWSERQEFLNTVYEGFFQGFSVKQADTHGIVYTPQEIVDFMCNSVEEVLKREFGTSVANPGVQILDPCVGTGSFIVNLVRHHIPRSKLKYKYQHDLFCNEIMLLPYYIASLNIEHEYYERMNEYLPFEGICFADTLELAQGQQLSMFVEQNTERVQREKDAQIMVVIGNPPYNVRQKSENDNNKNRKYAVIDERIRKTYAADSDASNKNALSDAYVKFFRWATDRLQGRDGVVCFVSNNSFVDQIAFDGMRKNLLQDFTRIYYLDLHGNVRKNPKLSGTTHNVFGIQVGVGITIAIRSSAHPERALYYYRVPEFWRKSEKLSFLTETCNLDNVEWKVLRPDGKNTWISEGRHSEFATYMPMGTREAKSSRVIEPSILFKNYGRGVATCRDDWAYDSDKSRLASKIIGFIDTFNSEIDRWHRRGNNTISVDNFVKYDDTKIKWSEGLKASLQRGHHIEFSDEKIRLSLYRPFNKQHLYFDRGIIERVYQFPQIFPLPKSEIENTVICLTDLASEKPFMALVSNVIPDLHLVGAGANAQCFPYYSYAEDGSNRRENITDWALTQFQAKYCPEVAKWDIFHYVYALLHHPQYRERYAENLKRDLPHIPLLHRVEAFQTCVRIGKQLMELHLHYEQTREYPLKWVENREVPFSWRVEKMKLTLDKTALIINESLRLEGIPHECFSYRLGNRSALEWVIDQYQVSEDKRSGIVSDPNNLDDEEYIVRLVGRVIAVSVDTVRLVNELQQSRKDGRLDERGTSDAVNNSIFEQALAVNIAAEWTGSFCKYFCLFSCLKYLLLCIITQPVYGYVAMKDRNMANQPIASRTLEESFTDALNIEGTFFERRCQYEISQAQNWNVRLYDHPVEFPPPYDATLAPLTQKSDLDIWAEHIADNLKLSLLIECKKHNPNLSDWVFFVSPISQSPLIRIIDINPPVTSNRLEDNLYWSARRSFWPLVTNLGFTDQALELKDDYKRWKNSQQNNGKNKQQQQFERAVNTSIHKASSQIALGTQAVIHQEQLEAEHLNMQVPQRPRPYRLQVFLPTIVTTANLWTCEFKAADVNLSTGEIDLGKVNYKKVSHLIYSFPLPSDLQYHPGDSRYQHREAKELEQMAHMAILVVQSAALPDVLTQLPSLMDNSSIKELKLTLS